MKRISMIVCILIATAGVAYAQDKQPAKPAGCLSCA
jgi:hypothetical protein